MTEQAQSSSQHLAAARELLDELQGVNQAPGTHPQIKATTAAAHAILVLAEQVAVVRVLLAAEAASQRTDGQAAPQP